jgi:hypothetical protein
VFTEPARLRPGKTWEAVAAEASRTLGEPAHSVFGIGLGAAQGGMRLVLDTHTVISALL